MSGSDIASIVAALIAAASAIAVAAIQKKASNAAHERDKKADEDRKRTEARAERRAKESRLSMDMMSATCELSVVTAIALRDHHTNGSLEPALVKAKAAQDEYQAFIMDEAAKAVAKV